MRITVLRFRSKSPELLLRGNEKAYTHKAPHMRWITDFLAMVAGMFRVREDTRTSERTAAGDTLRHLRRGVTTRAEVERLLGPPASVTTLADGGTVLFCRHEAPADARGMTVQRVFSFVPPIAPVLMNTGFILGPSSVGEAPGTGVSTRFLAIRLTKDGIVEDYASSERDDEPPHLFPSSPRPEEGGATVHTVSQLN